MERLVAVRYRALGISLVLCAIIGALLLASFRTVYTFRDSRAVASATPYACGATYHLPAPAPAPSALTDRQREWINALRWCESRGVDTAVNPHDKDGTPSYGRFQFKPGTFYYFANLYNVATSTGYMDPAAQEAVLEAMVAHSTQIDWLGQFPDCVANHIGYPPRSALSTSTPQQ